MGHLEAIEDYIARNVGAPDQLIDIEEVFTMSPKTPVSERHVAKMNNFEETVLKNCIICNIYLQHQGHEGGLTRSTWSKLLQFLKRNFNQGTETNKTYLQILLHFSKMSLDESTLKNYGFRGKEKMRFYNIMMNNFLHGALKEVTAETTVKRMDQEKVVELKRRLVSLPILEAILHSLTALEIEPPIDVNYISEKISTARIYEVNFFRPCQFLRGASLQDGFLVCSSNIAGYPFITLTHKADSLTLAAHEVSHYIARLIFNDLNFSSPWKKDSKEPRFDFGSVPQLLEIGRNTELVIFDGIQPNWLLSGDEAATVFLNRIDSNYPSLPVISKQEHVRSNILERKPSPFFGIDIKLEHVWLE